MVGLRELHVYGISVSSREIIIKNRTDLRTVLLNLSPKSHLW